MCAGSRKAQLALRLAIAALVLAGTCFIINGKPVVRIENVYLVKNEEDLNNEG